MNFKIGEKVVCIKPIDGLIKNEIYTIKFIKPKGGLVLKEIVDIEIGYDCFYSWRFRKIDYKFAEELLNNITREIEYDLRNS